MITVKTNANSRAMRYTTVSCVSSYEEVADTYADVSRLCPLCMTVCCWTPRCSRVVKSEPRLAHVCHKCCLCAVENIYGNPQAKQPGNPCAIAAPDTRRSYASTRSTCDSNDPRPKTQVGRLANRSGARQISSFVGPINSKCSGPSKIAFAGVTSIGRVEAR